MVVVCASPTLSTSSAPPITVTVCAVLQMLVPDGLKVSVRVLHDVVPPSVLNNAPPSLGTVIVTVMS